jgi:hypothetical protein
MQKIVLDFLHDLIFYVVSTMPLIIDCDKNVVFERQPRAVIPQVEQAKGLNRGNLSHFEQN